MKRTLKEDEISLEECRKLLEADGIPHTEEEVTRTRDLLDLIATMFVDQLFEGKLG